MSANPTRTTNPIHFSDLDPIRFEDLCLALIYPLHPWEDIRHYGRQGSDEGVDIFAIENLEDGSQRRWIVQCKRYSKASKSHLTKAVDKALTDSSQAPEVFLIVISCDVSRAAHEGYENHAADKGIETPLIWTQSVLEAKLYSDRQDLLFTYFDVSQAPESRKRERRIKRNLAMKRRVRAELLTGSVEPQDVTKQPNKRFCSTEAIIHSIDDTEYPWTSDTPEGRISGWFKLEFWDTYFNGISFILGIRYVIISANGAWAIVSHGQEINEGRLVKKKAWHIGQIPYRNIVEIDRHGDEYYPFPHIYCRFANAGEPYENHLYRLIDQDHFTLNSEDQTTFEDLASDLPRQQDA